MYSCSINESFGLKVKNLKNLNALKCINKKIVIIILKNSYYYPKEDRLIVLFLMERCISKFLFYY